MTVAFGKYQLLAELGQGGMADVFLAVQSGPAGFAKLTVLKQLRKNLAEDPEFVSMLVDEARIAARLNHANVVQTNEVGEVKGQYFIAMEYLDGQPLHRIQNRADVRAKDGTPTVLTSVVRYLVIADALAGLHHAHELTDYDGTPLEIVHRDVTPHNIFVTYEGHVKVVDFGIAKAANRISETRQGVVKGKVRFMAPEQAMGGNVDRRADIFSAGILLWEAASGLRMWKDVDDMDIVQRLLHGEHPRSPAAVAPNVPREIDRICRKALAPDPADRHATAEELRVDIERYLEESGELVRARRALSVVVSDLFKDKRAEIKSVIESQLALVHAQPPLSIAPASKVASGATNTFKMSPSSMTPTPIAISVRELAPSSVSSIPPQDHTKLLPGNAKHQGPANPTTLPSALPVPSPPPPFVRSRAVSTLPSLPGVVAAPAEPTPPPPAAKSKAGVVVVVAAIAAVALGLGGAVAWKKTHPSTPTTSEGATVAPPSSPTTMVTLHLNATPESALVRIDGSALQRLPLSAQMPRDVREHRLQFEAEGYTSKMVVVTFDKNVETSVELEPTTPAVAEPADSAKPKDSTSKHKVAGPAPHRPTPPTQPGPKPEPTPAATPSQKPKPPEKGLKIDPSNPW